MSKCKGTTKQGKRCGKCPMFNKEYCRMHHPKDSFLSSEKNLDNVNANNKCYVCLDSINADDDTEMKCDSKCYIHIHKSCSKELIGLNCPYCRNTMTSNKLSKEEQLIIMNRLDLSKINKELSDRLELLFNVRVSPLIVDYETIKTKINKLGTIYKDYNREQETAANDMQRMAINTKYINLLSEINI